ncbi:4-carboxy-4-hydroxy-2-oxoadipate aldolase/oxaloacetate decarboxylase [Amycolatopsis pithecellobii]|uniref:Putative 4-hydroxy-4-methyl-2-oxoglutarate aldolase n=1 Tax=Amycolatopsis pithecellobii TaxID=664692 RepID=A0A6N7Z1W2_9PSEU|nr:4-carboxy-4-hydroxy-2-oxoadipate aldolase/oxaloacetate decarboxylase [Amycolatopsis pithecellobii]MTD53740.1 4-carboxy-4-hydroxy-2-oxoadipate aldolase/oxaloacetate decarboxylase [Amycolatopsis pithecellobii]
MRNVVYTRPPRASSEAAAELGAFGTATVHEAQHRAGYLGASIRPAWPGARVGGTAVTALCWPGDNTMIHVAVEQCQAGDILVVATTSPCQDGLFGELFATALQHRGVIGAVLSCGVRDVAELHAMRFPVWSQYVSAQGTVKQTLGSVNAPVTVGGVLINPGDVLVADDDGAVCVPRDQVEDTRTSSRAREKKEAQTRARLRTGEVGLDIYGMRTRLTELGLEYCSHPESVDP